ncbi:MAG: sugar ABC transporter permease [Deltaproteobacteria bacterium HGW-Deltaproteobacteria-15]|jgi:multiple sugar transport system permease protein|nr:MAG: sugar ABC transporter permease [Deltaproteobacteria bacterium HGW-Deltaproteobacteria-15]
MKRPAHFAMLLMLCVFCLGPLLWQLVTSLKPNEILTTLPPILPDRFTMDHYISVLAERSFVKCMANSAGVAAMTTGLSLGIGSLCAFALAKLGTPFKAAVLGFVLSASMFPPIATVSPLYLIIRGLGLRDTLWALVLTYTSFSLPLSIWILTNFFRQIPDEIHRAARVDGCSPFQCFYRIMLPLSLPGLFTTAILVFIFSWNEFLFALTFTATEASRTVPVAIALFPGVHEIPWGEIAAASVTVTLPLIVVVFAFQKRIVEGLTAGAVKG